MDTTLLAYLVLIASALLVLLPFSLFAIGNVEKMTTAEFVRLYPQFSWIKRRHQVFLAIVFFLLATLAALILSNESKFGERYFLLFVPFTSGLSLFDGILAFKTRVYIFWDRYGYTFSYDKDGVKRWIAETQVALAIGLTIASLLLYFP